MEKPIIVITTGYESFFAYLLIPNGEPQLVKRIEFACDGPTNGPLVSWDNKRECYAEVAKLIKRVLNRYRCDTWGLACRSEQIQPLKNVLSSEHLSTLGAIIETDFEPIDRANVAARFDTARGSPTVA